MFASLTLDFPFANEDGWDSDGNPVEPPGREIAEFVRQTLSHDGSCFSEIFPHSLSNWEFGGTFVGLPVWFHVGPEWDSFNDPPGVDARPWLLFVQINRLRPFASNRKVAADLGRVCQRIEMLLETVGEIRARFDWKLNIEYWFRPPDRVDWSPSTPLAFKKP